MKKLLTVLLICSGMATMAQKTDFSGNYLINKSKTSFDDKPEWVLPKSLRITQATKSTIISRVRLNEQLQERPALADTVSFDGKPSKMPPVQGTDTKQTIALKWINDKMFEVNIQVITADGKPDGSIVETWTKEDSGKTLVVKRDVELGSGFKYTIKGVYDKQ